jgi:hypothetical protein
MQQVLAKVGASYYAWQSRTIVRPTGNWSAGSGELGVLMSLTARATSAGRSLCVMLREVKRFESGPEDMTQCELRRAQSQVKNRDAFDFVWTR